VPIVGVAIFVVAMQSDNHWLPEDISTHGSVIDDLFYSILYLTGVIFIGCGIAQFWFMWKFDAAKNTQPVKFLHGSHTLEIVWSIVPAATLLFIAIYQMNAWADSKMLRPEDGNGNKKAPIAQVVGRQFEWRISYAGEDGIVGTEDDVHTVNDLHLPVGEEIVLAIKSEDVLHDFFLPNCRVKQDVVPGMKQHIWFKPQKTGEYDIVCAELCGWGHYKMKGRMTIVSKSDFADWLDSTRKAQQTASFVASGDE
jgi:cytochrome c oxidase subunit 2